MHIKIHSDTLKHLRLIYSYLLLLGMFDFKSEHGQINSSQVNTLHSFTLSYISWEIIVTDGIMNITAVL